MGRGRETVAVVGRRSYGRAVGGLLGETWLASANTRQASRHFMGAVRQTHQTTPLFQLAIHGNGSKVHARVWLRAGRYSGMCNCVTRSLRYYCLGTLAALCALEGAVWNKDTEVL